MKRMKRKDLEPNSIVDGALFLANNDDFILIHYNIPVTEHMLALVDKWKLKSLYTDGSGELHRISTTAVESAAAFDDEEEEVERAATVELYKEFIERANHIFDFYKFKAALPADQLADFIKYVLVNLRRRKRFLLRSGDFRKISESYFIDHAIQTTILSLAIGDSLRFPIHRLIELGTTAFLHEIGELRLPKYLLQKTEVLTEADRKVLSTHSLIGYKILKELSFPVDVLMGVLEHHERVDGSGYTQGLKGEQISLYARIIGIACSYHAQIVDRPYHEAKEQYTSLMGMMKEMGKHYDNQLLKHLLTNLSIFPIGSVVRLTDGSLGVVIDADPDDILHPIVNVFFNPEGEALKPTQVVTLSSNLTISRVLVGEELDAFQQKTNYQQ